MDFIKKHFLGSLCSFGLIFVFCFIMLICFSPEVKASDEIITYNWNGVSYNVQVYYESHIENSIVVCDSNGVPSYLLFSNDNISSDLSFIYYNLDNGYHKHSIYISGFNYILRCNYGYDSARGIYGISWDNGYSLDGCFWDLSDGFFPVWCGRNMTYNFDNDVYWLYSQQPLQDSNSINFRAVYQTDYPELLPLFRSEEIESTPFNVANFYDRYKAYIDIDFSNETIEMQKIYNTLSETTFVFSYDNIVMNDIYYIKIIDTYTNEIIYTQFVEVNSIGFDVYYDNSPTDKPIYVYTDEFDFDTILVQYSLDKEEWTLFNTEIKDYVPGSIIESKEMFSCYLVKNGTYYFKFSLLSENNGEIIYGGDFYVVKDINNLTISDYLDDDYVPTPIISLDYNSDNESFVIKTQNFIIDKALNMYCYYTNDLNNDDIFTWERMELDFTTDDYIGYTASGLKYLKESSDFTTFKAAYFYFEIPLSTAQDTDYKIVFYNYLSEKSSEIVTYNFRYDNALDYVENELQVNLGLGTKFNNAIKFFKERFGFLSFPIDFVINILTRISNIEYKEPIIHFPTITIPGSDNVICNGFDYNFNSILEIDVINTLHDFLLIGVDFILISSLIVFTYKTLKEVLRK